MIAAVILTKNESVNLPKCLESVKWCDQVIVVDDASSDDTVKIAKKFGATVLSHSLNGDYSAQRNWVLGQIKSPWVLYLDADEVLSAKLIGEIKEAVTKIEFKGFFLPRLDFVWGQKLTHGDVGNVKLLRLARHGAGKWEGRVHETWNVEGKVGTLKNPIYHYPHPTIVEFLGHINKYSTLKAKEFFDQGKRTNLAAIVIGPVWRFFKSYILKLGFLDGTAGFIHAMIMSFYMFLVAGKLWLLYKGIPKNS